MNRSHALCQIAATALLRLPMSDSANSLSAVSAASAVGAV